MCTLEDMLRSSVIEFKDDCDDHFPFIKFAYNISYHLNIQMVLFKAHYGRICSLLLVG